MFFLPFKHALMHYVQKLGYALLQLLRATVSFSPLSRRTATHWLFSMSWGQSQS